MEKFKITDLMEAQLPEVKFCVDEVLPGGLCILASPPKLGKSWFALELCLAVSSGYNFLNRKTEMSGALYLALEDSANRIQSRVKQLWDGRPYPSNFDMWLKAPPLDNGLMPELETYIESNPKTKLVVIDTFQKIRGVSVRGETAYAYDYREMACLKEFADRHRICVLLVHHLRKMKDDDVFNMLSGTTGITGCADTILILTKSRRTDSEMLLNITGRDTPYLDLVLTRDTKTLILNVKDEITAKDEIATLDSFLENPVASVLYGLVKENNGTWQGTAEQFCDLCRTRSDVFIKETLVPSEMGKTLRDIAPLMYDFARIVYFPPSKGGKKGRVHTFKTQPADKGEQVTGNR